MNGVVIKVENLGKKYLIKHKKRESYKTFQDVLINSGKKIKTSLNPFHKATIKGNYSTEEFWALKDVDIEINQGEIVGIIGRNGAGKSTLLKVLSRITEPTTGKIHFNGRIASLLEVGTGFHPELTGRENIYLNGAILGMSQQEIKSKFDEIVAFAEIEKFLDTPVKRYSSGMYVRLAFSVAAHLEPEILVIDEVLAVGDIAFQKKCLGKMDEVSKKHGRTVLFVSHNMQTIRALCSRAVVLGAGIVVSDGSVFEAVDIYNGNLFDQDFSSTTSITDETIRRGSGSVRFDKILLLDAQGNERQVFEMGEKACFRLSYEVFQNVRNLYVSIAFRSGKMGEIITTLRHRISDEIIANGVKGSVELEIPKLNFRPGEYELYFWLGNHLSQPFDVVDGIFPPLVVYAEGEIDDLGFDPSQSIGFFNMPSKIN